MKINKSIVGWALVVSVVVFLLTLLDVLALSDIYKDYVSTSVLESVNLKISDQLPYWSDTKGEWTMVTISVLLKTAFMVVIIIALIKMVKKLNI